jgi:hypothetical protein
MAVAPSGDELDVEMSDLGIGEANVLLEALPAVG